MSQLTVLVAGGMLCNYGPLKLGLGEARTMTQGGNNAFNYQAVLYKALLCLDQYLENCSFPYRECLSTFLLTLKFLLEISHSSVDAL